MEKSIHETGPENVYLLWLGNISHKIYMYCFFWLYYYIYFTHSSIFFRIASLTEGNQIIMCLLSHNLTHADSLSVNTLRPRQNGRHFADNTFKPIYLNENIQISIKISLKFVPKVPINNISVLVQIMAWRRPGDKPLSEPVMVCLLTHICVTWPQWVNTLEQISIEFQTRCHNFDKRKCISKYHLQNVSHFISKPKCFSPLVKWKYSQIILIKTMVADVLAPCLKWGRVSIMYTILALRNVYV